MSIAFFFLFFFLEKYLPLTLLLGFEKVYSRFACERELETEHNWNILTPKVWPSALCLSRSPWLLNRGLGVHSAVCWLSLLHIVLLLLQLYLTVLLLFNSSALYYLQTPTRRYGYASTPPQFLPISGDRDVSLPLSLEWPLWSSSSGNNCHPVNRSLSSGESFWSGTFTFSHIISRAHLRDFFRLLTIGMCHFRYLRNGRCDRHRAEKTIMQFIGHSLPVHHFFYGTVRNFLPCLILWAKLYFTPRLRLATFDCASCITDAFVWHGSVT